MRSVAGGIDAIEAVFDDGSLVADAGLLLAGTVMSRLGLEALIDDTVRLGGRGRGPQGVDAGVVDAGRGRCIDDTDRLRSCSDSGIVGTDLDRRERDGRGTGRWSLSGTGAGRADGA